MRKSTPLVGHSCPVTSVKWVNNHTLSSVSLDSTLKLWDIRTAKHNTVQLECPSVSHTVLDENQFAIASCTNKIIHY